MIFRIMQSRETYYRVSLIANYKVFRNNIKQRIHTWKSHVCNAHSATVHLICTQKDLREWLNAMQRYTLH